MVDNQIEVDVNRIQDLSILLSHFIYLLINFSLFITHLKTPFLSGYYLKLI